MVLLAVCPTLASSTRLRKSSPSLDTCDAFPFFGESTWERFADSANLTTVTNPSRIYGNFGWLDYALEVKLPEMSEYVSNRGDDCLNGGAAREFMVQASLESPWGVVGNPSATDTVGDVLQLHRRIKFKRIFSDEIGVGGGVVDRLKEMLPPGVVQGVNSSHKALNDDLYVNKRAEMWGDMRECEAVSGGRYARAWGGMRCCRGGHRRGRRMGGRRPRVWRVCVGRSP